MKTEPVAQKGRREENKRDKLERIRKAANDVFLRKGFDDATLREIALVAKVAFGTLFLYAKDKQDLLLLVFDEELPNLSAKAFLRAPPKSGFVDQVTIFLDCFYDFFLRAPQLSRELMRHTTFVHGIVAKRVHLGFENTERHLAMIVSRAQAAGAINPALSPDLVAHMIFSLFRIEIRFCLGEDPPDRARSLGTLRGQLDLLQAGLVPRPAPTAANIRLARKRPAIKARGKSGSAR